MKKSLPEAKPAVPHRRKKSPLPSRKATAESNVRGLRTVNTLDGSLSTSLDEHHSGQDDSEAGESYLSLAMTTNGGSVSDATADDTDAHDGGHVIDPHRTQEAIERLQSKIDRTKNLIKSEQAAKEENVNEYLRLAVNADKQQQVRIKALFEKRNQKAAHTIAQLQRKLDNYQKRLQEVEQHGVSSHKQARELLRGVGQGLKGLFAKDATPRNGAQNRDVGANIRDGITGFSGGVVDHVRGAKESIVAKPKEFAHLIKHKFGSADNLSNIKNLEEGHCSGEELEAHQSNQCSGTLPPGFKYHSEDDASSITSGSGPSGVHSSPQPQSDSTKHLPEVPHVNLDFLIRELQEDRQLRTQLREDIENLKGQIQGDFAILKQTLDEERYRSERLEEQINDLTELHQNEVTNIKQELASMEEKMEYQLEERTRDMQDMLETCQTRITKMELQQQQQQLISMEGIENSNFRALLTKLINVLLALLAVILVFVSTIANLLGPFLTTRLRILSTIFIVACFVATWQNWSLVKDFGQGALDRYKHLVTPVQ